jgi:hypothetical protein
MNDATNPTGGAEPTWGWWPVLVVFAIVSAATSWPYLQATLLPPRGMAFVGTFLDVDDYYNDLSFVQQAEDGAFLFRNKLIPGSPATLVNLEWWLVGRLSSLLGHHPHLAYRLFGLLGSAALLTAVDRWLRRGGLPASHRLSAFVLVGFGAGLGGLRILLSGTPVWQGGDIFMGMFPFVEMLGSPHLVVATSLLTWSLYLLIFGRRPGPLFAGVLLGTVLGLSRPYDLILLTAAYALAIIIVEPRSARLRRALPALGLCPVIAYDLHVFFRQPYFASLARSYTAPTAVVLTALGPCVALAAIAYGRTIDDSARRVRAALGAWALLAIAIAALAWAPWPLELGPQFLAGVGVPLLVLGALGLDRFRPGWTLAAAAPLAATSLFTLRAVSGPSLVWYEPREIMDKAEGFRGVCLPGDILVAPDDLGRYAAGLSACDSYVSHPVEPGHAQRVRRVNALYAWLPPEARARLLDETCASFVVLPGASERPIARLGEASTFRLVAARKPGFQSQSIYGRPRPKGCTAAADRP